MSSIDATDLGQEFGQIDDYHKNMKLIENLFIFLIFKYSNSTDLFCMQITLSQTPISNTFPPQPSITKVYIRHHLQSTTSVPIEMNTSTKPYDN
jgi:hypothetical protein